MVNRQTAAETIFFPFAKIITKCPKCSSLARANSVAKEKLYL